MTAVHVILSKASPERQDAKEYRGLQSGDYNPVTTLPTDTRKGPRHIRQVTGTNVITGAHDTGREGASGVVTTKLFDDSPCLRSVAIL